MRNTQFQEQEGVLRYWKIKTATIMALTRHLCVICTVDRNLLCNHSYAAGYGLFILALR